MLFGWSKYIRAKVVRTQARCSLCEPSRPSPTDRGARVAASPKAKTGDFHINSPIGRLLHHNSKIDRLAFKAGTTYSIKYVHTAG